MTTGQGAGVAVALGVRWRRASPWSWAWRRASPPESASASPWGSRRRCPPSGRACRRSRAPSSPSPAARVSRFRTRARRRRSRRSRSPSRWRSPCGSAGASPPRPGARGRRRGGGATGRWRPSRPRSARRRRAPSPPATRRPPPPRPRRRRRRRTEHAGLQPDGRQHGQEQRERARAGRCSCSRNSRQPAHVAQVAPQRRCAAASRRAARELLADVLASASRASRLAISDERAWNTSAFTFSRRTPSTSAISLVRDAADLGEHERGALLLGQPRDVAEQVAQVLAALDLGGQVLGRRLGRRPRAAARGGRAAPSRQRLRAIV